MEIDLLDENNVGFIQMKFLEMVGIGFFMNKNKTRNFMLKSQNM